MFHSEVQLLTARRLSIHRKPDEGGTVSFGYSLDESLCRKETSTFYDSPPCNPTENLLYYASLTPRGSITRTKTTKDKRQ